MKQYYLLLLGLMAIISCQSTPESNTALNEWLAEANMASFQQIRQGIETSLEEAKKKHEGAVQYTVIWKKTDTLMQSNNELLRQLEGERVSEELDSFRNKLVNLKETYLEKVARLWDNGGIKGIIFVDERKKDSFLKNLEKS